MADIQQATAPTNHQSNGTPELDRLAARVKELESECQTLRESLTRSEEDRKNYIKAICESARADREFEDLDIPTLMAMSAGPVEMIED